MFTSEYVYDFLKQHIAVVNFTKVDGSQRRMRCTLKDSYLPETYRGKDQSVKESVPTLRVFDLDLNEWRSFRVESVTSIQEDKNG